MSKTIFFFLSFYLIILAIAIDSTIHFTSKHNISVPKFLTLDDILIAIRQHNKQLLIKSISVIIYVDPSKICVLVLT